MKDKLKDNWVVNTTRGNNLFSSKIFIWTKSHIKCVFINFKEKKHLSIVFLRIDFYNTIDLYVSLHV